MNPSICQAVVLAAVMFQILPAAQAQSLDQIGVTLLRAATTNLNGTGIRVAQPEAYNGDNGSTNSWEVNPANVGQPTALFTYTSDLGTSTSYPNSVGDWSSHADAVGNNFYGLPNGVATNLAHVNNSAADYFVQGQGIIVGPVTNYTFTLPGAKPTDSIVNQSFIFGSVPDQVPVTEQQAIDTAYDNYAATNQTLFVSGAGNGGRVCPPSTSYNGLSVAAYGSGASSSIGPTVDNGRSKPDITAPGYPATMTSFSTPYVAGAAAVLMQAALRGDGGSDTNSAFKTRTIKALLLNGAVKPADWTNGTATPLDARYGVGVLNVFNSYKQLAGGKSDYIVSNSVSLNAAHPPTGAAGTVTGLFGWNFSTNISGKSVSSSSQFDTIHHYYFNVSNSLSTASFNATATLVWNRQLNQSGINSLNLFLYNCANSNLIACSTSLVDNVEHIYVTNLAQGRYDLQVWKAGGNNASVISAAEPYALAWQFVQPPTLTLAKAGTNLNLTWPYYPAGFVVEANTNLLSSGSWSTNQLLAVMFTNGQNTLVLQPTNATKFFRLRQP